VNMEETFEIFEKFEFQVRSYCRKDFYGDYK
jgi:hypothetical protein